MSVSEKMTEARKSLWTTRPISHEEAKAAALRLIAGSFRRDGERLELGKRPEFSIPCRPDQDDDCVILAYIEQQSAGRAKLEGERDDRT